ncbi:MAG: PEP-CTERM sorting domain-containing protein [Planctomycetota bacterium]|jgi:hypothetical protein
MDTSTFYLNVIRLAALASLAIAICEAGATPMETQQYQDEFNIISSSVVSDQFVISSTTISDANFYSDIETPPQNQAQTAAVPEPATVLILGLGSMILVYKRKRK